MTETALNLPLRTRLWLLLAIVISLVAIDQWTKAYAVTHWKGQAPQIYFDDLFRIEYAENPGAFLSLLADMPTMRFWVLTVLNSVMLLVVAWCVLFSRQLTMPIFLAWTLILAGGIGNLIDRIRLGVVIDFLNLGVGGLRTGIFNVADMAITAGFILFLPLLFRSEPSTQSAVATPALKPSAE